MKSNKNIVTNSNPNQKLNSISKGYSSNDCRKIVYEKINIVNNSGEGKKYIKGPSIVRNIRGGNYNNQCHKEIIKYQLNNNNINDYSIQNFIKKEKKDDKTGPRVIMPKKMLVGNN